jgi:hypothetical protein
LCKEPILFCNISADTRKTGPSIAAHLDATLKELTRGRSEKFRKLILFSDSPSSQDRNRNTIFLINHPCDKYKFQNFEWICTEQGHGKSSADGIGAAIKRRADSHVAHGGSIKQINDLIEVLSESKIIVKTVSCTLCSF